MAVLLVFVCDLATNNVVAMLNILFIEHEEFSCVGDHRDPLFFLKAL